MTVKTYLKSISLILSLVMVFCTISPMAVLSAEDGGYPLYDSKTDTIYIYNSYQLAVMEMENADEQPVLDGDANSDTFGTGKLIFPDGESKQYLTYSSDHNYVIADDFEKNVKRSPSIVKKSPTLRANPAQYDGRDFQGQVIKTLNGVDYILIGNEDQLRAIGTDAPVYTAIYRADMMSMIYGGDADLLQSQNSTADYNFHKFIDIAGVLEYGVYQSGRRMGEINSIHNSYDTGKKYSDTENYIVFRDIDLENRAWTPLMFYGTMTGAKAFSGETLWNSTDINTTNRPVISNVNILHDTDTDNDGVIDIDISDYCGVGFFATLTTSLKNASRQVKISNIELSDVNVVNNATELVVDTSVINTVTETLGGVLGSIVRILVRVLSLGTVTPNTDYTLSDMLDAKTKDMSNLATGAFAGRVLGNVEIDNCAVTGEVSVISASDRTGGFVGYSDGEIKYGFLTKALDEVATLLADVLNVIPWLGLGDLVTILLKNGLPIGKLMPTGYINPVIKDCEVDGLGNIGHLVEVTDDVTGEVSLSPVKDTSMIGGFIGQQIGTIIEGSTVKNSDYTIYAEEYGGGFAGIARDEQIRSTLTDVGLDFPNLLDAMQPKSLLKDCGIIDCDVSVEGEDDLGGFVGALCSSYAVNCSIDKDVSQSNSVSVTGSGDCIGGFCGNASLGWFFSGKDDDDEKSSLLSIVGGLVTSLLSNDGKRTALLSLMGAEPSAIMGVEMDCDEIDVSGDNYVGGILGKGGGVYLTESSGEYLGNLAFWEHDRIDMPDESEVRNNYINGLQSISASGNYAGGIAGSVETASAVGLLGSTLGLGFDSEGIFHSNTLVKLSDLGLGTNKTLTVDDVLKNGNFIGFTVSNVTVDGVEDGYTVTADQDCAGGGFGAAIGGTITDVVLNNLQSVTANNKAAGFTGCSGPGDLVGSDGLSINLLGLNNLLTVKNLLSIGESVEVEMTNCTVNGISSGFEVEAVGSGGTKPYTAAGFIAKSNSTKVTSSHVHNLKSVTASNLNGYAGGFLGTSECGGLAEITELDDTTHNLKGIEIGNLVDLVSYLVPKYENCTVSYIDNGFVQADLAGGFVADLESGTVDNSSRTNDYYAVYNIDEVRGRTYGGGFGGKLISGALADAGGGISVLGGLNTGALDIKGLVGVMKAYVPIVKYAGVYSQNGFTVVADDVRHDDLTSGSAGGFAGYTSGAQISYSDVYRLKHTDVVPPSDLEAVNASTYYDGTSEYAVDGGRYAGGYVGNMDIGSAASVGEGLKVLGNNIKLTNVLDALSVVVTTIEHSDVHGSPGGFAIIADGTDSGNIVGMSGGFAGNISGGHIQDSHSWNFSYIIGEEAAGGYVGNMQPGNVANILNDGSILGGLVNVDSALASLVEDFIPTIRNSMTTCIPCGGAVRANAPSDAVHQRGCAGGYCGHSEGGQIWGNDSHTWKEENDGTDPITDKHTIGNYIGEQHECRADRIRSVYGYEYAGGFTGYMESADTASTGSIGLLQGVLPNDILQINVNNVLDALECVYPTETNTAVYGPLRNLDVSTWNAWVKYVGKYGGYGMELGVSEGIIDTENLTETQQQEKLNRLIEKYKYGYHVVAGRSQHDQMIITEGGSAGGYVGMMSTGVITNGQAYDAKLVRAMRSSGGFAGKMVTGGAASLGTVNIAGLQMNLGQLLKAAQVFVPTVKSSSVSGYQSGLTVTATGDDFIHNCGYAGGYVGSGYGAQIWGDENADGLQPTGCNVKNLRWVYGRNAVGGYAGLLTAASVADVNTNISDGLLQKVLNTVITSPNNVASVLQATVSTVRNAEVSADNTEWGFSIDGYSQTPPIYAGGFAGLLEASVIGDKDGNTNIKVKNLRNVTGGLYAGGFFGLADVGGVAQVSSSGENQVSILSLIKAGQVDVLDVFRTYIYHAGVEGVNDGITVKATSSDSEGLLSETRYAGCAGGFGGGMMNGTVKNATVSPVNTVEGLNYTGGFIGHMGKNGVADVDSANISKLLGLTAGVLDVFGAHAEDCSVEGINDGMVIISKDGAESISSGFVGYADVSRVKNSHITKLKQVYSDEIAGGFVGKTKMHYVVELEADSPLVNVILKVVNFLVKALYLPNLENAGLLDLEIPGLAELKLLTDGDVAYINLLGLKIGVSLVKAVEPGQTDTAIITLGDSSIRLPCTDEGIDTQGQDHEIAVNLLKGNATKIENCYVTGINIGYDVYGGGASNYADGTDTNGYAGGFVGYNDEGRMINNEMIYCDVVRGYSGKVGHFDGLATLNTVYNHDVSELERGNRYHVYRVADSSYQYALTAAHQQIGSVQQQDTAAGVTYNRYDVIHRAVPIAEYANWENAVMSKTLSGGSDDIPIEVYESSAKAVLMKGVPTMLNDDTLTPEAEEMQDPCERTIDFTIQKVWDDFGNHDNIRPESISIKIWQHSHNADGTEVFDGNNEPLKVLYDTITMSAADNGKAGSDIWKTVITGLLAAEVLANNEIVYYSYTVEEFSIAGYSTRIEYDESGYSAVITNVHRPELPMTGKHGDWIFVIVGIGMIMSGIVFFKKRKGGVVLGKK